MELVQAIAWFRTTIFGELFLETEDEILYWRGKEIAKQEKLNDVHELQTFFIQKGLGILEFHWIDEQHVNVGITNSPLSQFYPSATKTIALECGLITGMLQLKYQMKAQGNAQWLVPNDAPPYIEVTVTLEHPRK